MSALVGVDVPADALRQTPYEGSLQPMRAAPMGRRWVMPSLGPRTLPRMKQIL
jgi:hypothetical protein